MTEEAAPIGIDTVTPTAGAMLRAAREKRGMHIAALAASIKVPQRKLEALEADRYEDLVDLTFTRALAQTVCRALRVDAQPVLDRLPEASLGTGTRLAHVGSGINAPYREPPGREEPRDWSWMRRPVFWGTLIVLGAAAALAFAPETMIGNLLRGSGGSGAPAAAKAPAIAKPVATPVATPAAPPATIAATAPAAAPVVEPPASAAMVPEVSTAAPTAAPAAAPVPAGQGLTIKTTAASWVEVQDVNGITVLSRSLQAGETVSVDGAVPLRVTVGNAGATTLSFRGQAVDLAPNTVGNVARLQLN